MLPPTFMILGKDIDKVELLGVSRFRFLLSAPIVIIFPTECNMD